VIIQTGFTACLVYPFYPKYRSKPFPRVKDTTQQYENHGKLNRIALRVTSLKKAEAAIYFSSLQIVIRGIYMKPQGCKN
jgi:hypothetical protein